MKVMRCMMPKICKLRLFYYYYCIFMCIYDALIFFLVDIRKVIKIQFINQFGFDESGVDGGGIFKEFMCDFLKSAFNPNRGFFLLNSEQELYPNPNVEALYPNFKAHYYFIGRMVAKVFFLAHAN